MRALIQGSVFVRRLPRSWLMGKLAPATRGSMERLSPIMMTALTAGLALLPLALAGGEPGNEIQSPMAVVVPGGLLTSLALNMVVVPVLDLRHGANNGIRTP